MFDHPMDNGQGARRPAPQRRWDRFVEIYGWRAYALPILLVVTIAVLVDNVHSASPASAPVARGAGSSTQAAGGSGTAAPAKARERVEGLTAGGAGFSPGATPKPVVINLGNDVTSCADNTYDRLILVSIKKQHLWACQGGKQVNSTPVTTGASSDDMRTPLGSWRVQAKQRDRYLVGEGYRDYVKYWVPFNGDFGLHDASWQTMPFGSKDYRTLGSHGCVHVPTPQMAWIYKWAQVADTVVTIEA